MVGAPEIQPRRGSLSVQGVARSRGGVRVLQDAQLEVRPGEFVTLLGPSGCGKTTLLRLIGGLDPVDAGRIHVSGRDVTDQPAHERPVHTVFQSYALFPHLSVFENVAFGLRLRNAAEADIQKRVSEALALVRLQGLESRRPSELSGGQGQRVALARALVLEPDILLLDEPLAALDAQLRGAMRAELVQLQRSLGTTFILVTHDLEEAIECSSRIAVMRAGRIEQIGEPRAIFEQPVSLYVAKLVGMENLLAAEVRERTATTIRIDLGFTTIEVPPTEALTGLPEGGAVTVGVHGEHVRLSPLDSANAANPSNSGGPTDLQGTVRDTRYLGETVRCVVALGAASLVAHTAPNEAPTAGDRVRISIAASAWCVLPA